MRVMIWRFLCGAIVASALVLFHQPASWASAQGAVDTRAVAVPVENQGFASFTVPGDPTFARDKQQAFYQHPGRDPNGKVVEDIILQSTADAIASFTDWNLIAFAGASGPCAPGEASAGTADFSLSDQLHVVSDGLPQSTPVDVILSVQYAIRAESIAAATDTGFRPYAQSNVTVRLSGTVSSGAYYYDEAQLSPSFADHRVGKWVQKFPSFVGDTLDLTLSVYLFASAIDGGAYTPPDSWTYGGGSVKIWAGQFLSGPWAGTVFVTPMDPSVRLVADSGHDYVMHFADTNGDGRVDLPDAIAIAAQAAGLTETQSVLVGDVAPFPSGGMPGFGDGKVDLLDAFRVLRHVNGLDNNPPWSQ